VFFVIFWFVFLVFCGKKVGVVEEWFLLGICDFFGWLGVVKRVVLRGRSVVRGWQEDGDFCGWISATFFKYFFLRSRPLPPRRDGTFRGWEAVG
jgi:hypothetical protein